MRAFVIDEIKWEKIDGGDHVASSRQMALISACKGNDVIKLNQTLTKEQYSDAELFYCATKGLNAGSFTNRENVIKRLVELFPQVVNCAGFHDNPAIIAYALSWDYKGIQFLLEHGADVNLEAKTSNPEKYITPLGAVLSHLRLGMGKDLLITLKVLLNAGANTTHNSVTFEGTGIEQPQNFSDWLNRSLSNFKINPNQIPVITPIRDDIIKRNPLPADQTRRYILPFRNSGHSQSFYQAATPFEQHRKLDSEEYRREP